MPDANWHIESLVESRGELPPKGRDPPPFNPNDAPAADFCLSLSLLLAHPSTTTNTQKGKFMAEENDPIDPKKHLQKTKDLGTQTAAFSATYDRAEAIDKEIAKLIDQMEKLQKAQDFEKSQVAAANLQVLLKNRENMFQILSKTAQTMQDTNEAIVKNLR
jgi:hypothetical protein